MAEFSTSKSLISSYLSDESGIVGQAAGICFPNSEEEVTACVQLAQSQCMPLTIQGARTGYYGLAVPSGGYIINLSRLNRFLAFRFDPATSAASIEVEAGVTLESLNQTLLEKSSSMSWTDPSSSASWDLYRKSGITLFFPPDPTEKSATIGGILASGAKGSHVYAYGESMSHVLELKHVPFSDSGSNREIITSCTLKLSNKPAYTYALMAFGSDYLSLLHFLQVLSQSHTEGGAFLSGADFYDRSCFQLAAMLPALSQVPALPADARCALCLELSAQNEDSLYSLLESALTAMDSAALAADNALVAASPKEIQRLESIRHLLTETANSLSYGKEKFIVDTTLSPSQPNEYPQLLQTLSQQLEHSALTGFLLGYAGTENFHLRLLPENAEEERLASEFLALPALKAL